MSNVTSEDEILRGVAGVRFYTRVQQGSDAERALQSIQYKLSDGNDLLPDDTTEPHLALVTIQALDGPSIDVITLWVPRDMKGEAEALLTSSGFSLT